MDLLRLHDRAVLVGEAVCLFTLTAWLSSSVNGRGVLLGCHLQLLKKSTFL